jgi:hypothetical protein
MKNIKPFCVFFLAAVCLLGAKMTSAQTPTQFNYQAVLRNSDGATVNNQSVSIKVEILQGSATGTVVFTETQSVITSVQGLINLQIGSVNSGLGSINWGTSSHFVRIWVNDVEFGTSQLLSVPYAMHSKTAEIAIESDPVFSAWDKNFNDLTNKPGNATTSTDGFMSSADKTKLDGLQNVNITAGAGISVTGTFPNLTITNTEASSPTYTTGMNESLGGYVLYVTPDGKHGLVVATSNQSTSESWYYAQNAISNPNNFNAAGKKFTDWRLPTRYELSLIWIHRNNIGGFMSTNYWSSTESDASNAWVRSFNTGIEGVSGKSISYPIRAVRTF